MAIRIRITKVTIAAKSYQEIEKQNKQSTSDDGPEMKVKRNRKRDKKEEERQLTRTLLARLAKSCFSKLAVT